MAPENDWALYRSTENRAAFALRFFQKQALLLVEAA